MTVKRIVVNIATDHLDDAKCFYQDILGLDELMNLGWIQTYGNSTQHSVQLSICSEGGSGTAVPDMSIEVDNLNVVYQAMLDAGFTIQYQLTEEPWGVRRFFVIDPFGKVINILSHS